MTTTLQIRLLDTFELRSNGALVTTVDSARLQSLLAYLLLHRSSPQHRHHVAFLFWPDTTEAQARTNLRKLLLLLRRALPDAAQFLEVTAKTIQWRADAPYELDVQRFEQGCAADSPAAWQAAIDLYRGELLPSCYDDWIFSARERLNQTFVETAERLIQHLEAAHEPHRAVHYVQRLLRHDPVRETTYRQLMQLHMQLADRASALRVYHKCATVLRRDLDVEPSEETQSLYRRLMDDESVSVYVPSDIEQPVAEGPIAEHAATLIGRHSEWQALQSLWRQLTPNNPHLALITGEAGIGKTHLAEVYLHWASQLGATVAQARSWSGEGRIAYAPITALLRSEVMQSQLGHLDTVWLTQIARLLPELRTDYPELPDPNPLHEDWQRQRFFDALARAVTVSSAPHMLLVDDLQWCDRQTLEWLRFFLHGDYGRPLLVVGTMRVEGMDDNAALAALLLSLRQAGQITELELRPLEPGDVTSLASQMSGLQLTPDLAGQLYHRTQGNPLFVVETVRAGMHSGTSSVLDLEGAMPARIKAVIQERLRQLSPAAQDAAAVAAAIGCSFTFPVLAAAAQLEDTVLIRSIDELWRRRIMREQSMDAYDFSHDSIREVVYAQLSPIRRRMLHRNIADAIEVVYRDKLEEAYGELAVHFEHAGEHEKATAYRLLAGQQALDTYALPDAIWHYEQAQTLAAERTVQVDAYFGLARAHFAADQLDEALTSILQALQLVEGHDPRTASLFLLQAEILFACYEVDAAESAARAAQQAAETMGEQEVICQSLSLLGQICSARGDLNLEVDYISQALSLSRQAHNRWREGRALADLGWLQAQRADFTAAIAAAEQALAILTTTDDRAGVAFTWNVLGRAHGGCGHYAAAFTAFQRSEELAAAIDHKFLLAQAPNLLGWLHQQLYDFTSALALDEQGVALAQQWDKTPAEISARINLALDHLFLGYPDRALSESVEIQRQIERNAFGFHAWRWRLRLLHAQGLCRLARHEADLASELARQGIALANRTSSYKYVALNQALLGMAHAQQGHARMAIPALKSAIELADEIGYQPLRWEGRWHLAELAIKTRDGDEPQWLQQAAQIVRDAATTLDDTPLRSTFSAAAPIKAILQAADTSIR
ncbi:MAG: AAA family ATPase [Caldilineaceae bacterium]|nr:AAA family ATPase [Caldilineaceae bacterium]